MDAPGKPSDLESVSELMPEFYDELRRLARLYIKREKPGQSLQATALVNEAYIRLHEEKKRPWKNRAHFIAIAARAMRQILIERARARAASKRGGSRIRITLGETIAAGRETSVDLLALDQALTNLGEFDPDLARIVELRFFGGLTVEEAAETLNVSPATVKRGWSLARAWIRREVLQEKARES